MSYKHYLLTAAMTMMCVVMAACVDDKYDLSDIDSTVKVEVDNLVVPIKMDEIKLESIIPDDKRVKVIDGRYAFVETGRFWSNPVYIAPVWMISRLIYSKSTAVQYDAPAGDVAEFDFSISGGEYELHTSILPEDITYIDDVTGDIEINVKFTLEHAKVFAKQISFVNLVIVLPKGLTVTDAAGGVYDAETGELTIAELSVDDESATLVIRANRAKLTSMDYAFEIDPRKVTAKGEMSIKSGKLRLSGLNDNPTADRINIYASYEISDFLLDTYTGGLDYYYQGLCFDDVRLDGLPDFLSQAGTDIRLVNPCLFLKVHNPMQTYDLYSMTGMYINAWHGFEQTRYSIDNDDFRIGTENPDGIYNYCLSPFIPQSPAEGFDNAEHVGYKSLSDILSNAGNPDYGIPSSLEIKMEKPHIPAQYVVDMPVGIFLDEVIGTYEFRAPLALEPGSVIKYQHTVTGWGGDEFDYITVTRLDIDAVVTCDIPLALEMKAYPVNWRGEDIGGVEIKGVRINAGSQPQPVHITITGDVTGFDGIRYEAIATSGDNEELRADMNISITDLRPTISGYYLKKL